MGPNQRNQWRHDLWLLTALLPMAAVAYEPDPELRKALSKTEKQTLVEATPAAQKFSVRVSFSPKTAFRDYERIAQEAGVEPYVDCSVAAFTGVTNWRLIQGGEITSAQIGGLVEQCQADPETVFGPKPMSQATGDREILRGIWQRNLEFMAKSLGDNDLYAFLQNDAADRFRKLYGDSSRWALTDQGFREQTAASAAPATEATAAPSGQKAPKPTSPAVATNRRDIEGIALRTVTRYGLAGVYVENETYLLLKDGTLLRNFSDNPYTLNVAASRRSIPKNWGRWRAQGNALQVTWPGKKPALWKTWHTTRPAAPGQRIEGRFQSADGFGGGRVANFNTVAFSNNGQFAWASLKGGNSGGWLPVYSDQRRAGRYELDGHVIRLRYNDGSTEEYAFCFYPKDNQHFVIGSNHFAALD